MDDHPSNEEVLFFKIGVTGLLWGLGEVWPEHREFFYIVGIGSGVGVSLSNTYVYHKRRPK
jgi:hypothetical protein